MLDFCQDDSELLMSSRGRFSREKWRRYSYIFLSMVIMFLMAFMVMFGSIFLSVRNCEDQDGPFMLVTSHDYHNVYKFTLDGCLVKSNVLWGGLARYRGGLRGVKLGTYKGEEALYVADSGKLKKSGYNYWSKVLVFGKSNWLTGFRNYEATVYDASEDLAGSHPYGITFDEEGNIYVSFQHTDNVLRFYADTFERMPLPTALVEISGGNVTSNGDDAHSKEEVAVTRALESKIGEGDDSLAFAPGSFFQFGEVGIHKASEQGMRAVCWLDGHLWIANENKSEVKQGILIIDEHGYVTGSVNIRKPIYITYVPEQSPYVWVGTKRSSSGRFDGMVVAINKDTLKIEKVFKSKALTHPTGMILVDGELYVGDQETNKVLIFDLETAVQTGEVNVGPSLKGDIELLEISYD